MLQRWVRGQLIRDILGQMFILFSVGTLLVWVPTGPLLKKAWVDAKPTLRSRVGEIANRETMSREETVFSLREDLLRLEAIRGN